VPRAARSACGRAHRPAPLGDAVLRRWSRRRDQLNVVPGVCELSVDCRMLPEMTTAEMEPIIRAGVPGDWELGWVEREVLGGSRSPLETPLWRSLQAWVDRVDPGALLAPICSSGFTDSHYLRTRLGTCSYGFFPLRAMDATYAWTSCTRPTSGSRSTTWSSASICSGTWRRRSNRERCPTACSECRGLRRRRARAE